MDPAVEHVLWCVYNGLQPGDIVSAFGMNPIDGADWHLVQALIASKHRLAIETLARRENVEMEAA